MAMQTMILSFLTAGILFVVFILMILKKGEDIYIGCLLNIWEFMDSLLVRRDQRQKGSVNIMSQVKIITNVIMGHCLNSNSLVPTVFLNIQSSLLSKILGTNTA